MRTRIKICCIASLDEARIAAEAGADALGLVGAMPSGPGPIEDAAIAAITAAVPPPVATFLLTAETEAEAISDHVRRTRPTAVQLVNHLEPRELARLAMLVPGTKRVQVVHVEDETAIGLVRDYAPHADAILLDSGRPGLAVPELGGTGRVHDWSISARIVRTSPKPVFLAGGLGPENGGEAIARVGPFGIDLCSSVRMEGRLDATRVRALVRAVAAADRQGRALANASGRLAPGQAVGARSLEQPGAKQA